MREWAKSLVDKMDSEDAMIQKAIEKKMTQKESELAIKDFIDALMRSHDKIDK